MLLAAIVAFAGSPGLEPAEAEPEATWERATALAARGQRSNRKGDLIGAVGISGDNSDNDEAAAMTGIEAAGFVADPG